MANDLNQCMFIGRLGADPESRFMPNGKAVTNFRIAVGESWKNEAGEKQEKTEWVRITTYGKLAEICEKYLTKGSQVFVQGKMATRKWQNKDGVDQYSTEIVADKMQMLDRKGGGGDSRPSAGNEPQSYDDFDDSVPF